jgi:hypothetical protein
VLLPRQRTKLARGAKDKLKIIIFWIVAMHTRLPSWVDAVEKGFSVPERRRIFQERLPVENIDSNISFGFYYCPSWRVRRSLIDFFNSIGHY